MQNGGNLRLFLTNSLSNSITYFIKKKKCGGSIISYQANMEDQILPKIAGGNFPLILVWDKELNKILVGHFGIG